MGFLDELRRYLERVGQTPEGLPYTEIDVAAHRRSLLETVEHHWSRDREAAGRVRLEWDSGRRFVAIIQRPIQPNRAPWVHATAASS